MNLFTLYARGIALSGGTEADRASEAARTQWLNALLVDQTRAWMSINEADRATLSGLAALLTLACGAHLYDHRRTPGAIDSPTVRILRAGISTAHQCGQAGSVITQLHASSLSHAADRAAAVIQHASRAAIQHAAQELHGVVHGGRLQGVMA